VEGCMVRPHILMVMWGVGT